MGVHLPDDKSSLTSIVIRKEGGPVMSKPNWFDCGPAVVEKFSILGSHLVGRGDGKSEKSSQPVVSG